MLEWIENAMSSWRKGFEMDKQLSMVRRVVECQPTEQPFNLEAAKHQEEKQPR